MKNKLLLMLGLLFACAVANAIPPGEDYPVNVVDSNDNVVWTGSYDEFTSLCDSGHHPGLAHR